MSSVNFINDGDDMGSDFDDVEAHVQDSSKFKVKTGYQTLDHMLGGGWDIGTLNMLMGETNSGKSLWMQNLAVASANQGYNVLYITLEMSERKVLKRVGAMRLKIPVNDYDTIQEMTRFVAKGQSYEEILIEDFLGARMNNDQQLVLKYHNLISNKVLSTLTTVENVESEEATAEKAEAFAEALRSLSNGSHKDAR